MSRRIPRRVLASLLTAAGLAGAAFAVAPAVEANGHGHGPTIRLTETSAVPELAFVDANKPGPSAGDQVVLRDGVDRADGGPSGVLRQACTLVEPGSNPFTSTYECMGSIALDEGTLIMQGPFVPAAAEQSQAITGGTGAFRAAAGEAQIRAEADEIVVRLAR
jgi:hypothetical protein